MGSESRGAMCAVAIAFLFFGADVSAGAKKKPKTTSDKREKARELEAMAELAEQVGDVDKTIALLDELRKVCAQKGPPCETKDSDILEQIGWLCLKSKACAPRRPALLEELQKKAPQKKDLIHDLKNTEEDDKGTSDTGDTSGKVDYETPSEKASIEELRAHLQKHPGDLDARMDLADKLIKDGKSADAAHELSIYLESRPGDLEAREQLIDELVAIDRKSAALSEISAYLKRRPNAWKMRALEIELLAEQKRTLDLDRALDRMMKEAPNKGLAWAYLAERAVERDDPDEAERDLVKARTSTDAETVEKIREVEADLAEMHQQVERGFRRDARRYDFEDDLRYGGETE